MQDKSWQQKCDIRVFLCHTSSKLITDFDDVQKKKRLFSESLLRLSFSLFLAWRVVVLGFIFQPMKTLFLFLEAGRVKETEGNQSGDKPVII